MLIQIAESQSQIVVSPDGGRPETTKGRLVSLAALGGVWSDWVTSSARGASREGATADDIVIHAKTRGFRREHRRRGTGIGPAPRRGGGGRLPGLTVM